MTLSPNAQRIADKYGQQQEETLWQERSQRLAKLIGLKAPRVIVVDNCLLLLHHHGMVRSVAMWFRLHYWSKWTFSLWHFWQSCILGLSHDEIEDKILEDL